MPAEMWGGGGGGGVTWPKLGRAWAGHNAVFTSPKSALAMIIISNLKT